MDEMQSPAASRAPGIVLFVSILNFIFAAAWILIALTSLIVMVAGASAGVYEQITNQLSQAQPPINLAFGMTFFFVFMLILASAFAAFFLAIGLGLLKRKRFAWYLQVAMSVLGLLGFPFFTVLNGFILAFFFQSPVRNHYNV